MENKGDQKPWVVVWLLDDKAPVRYASDVEAYKATKGQAVDIVYKPRKRRVKR